LLGRPFIPGFLVLLLSLGCGSPSMVSTEGSVATSTKTQTSTGVSTSSSISDPDAIDRSARVASDQDDGLGQESGGVSTPADQSTPEDQAQDPQAQDEAAAGSDCIEAPSQWECDVEKEIAALVSTERQNVGLNPLTLDPKLSWVARVWSTEQANLRSISHDWFQTGQLKSTYRDKFGVDPRISAENVAMVPCSRDARATAQSFMSGWMNSPGHRANILRGGQSTIGVGIAAAGGSCYGTQDFGF
jgi:uncharacterized protein YkwD